MQKEKDMRTNKIRSTDEYLALLSEEQRGTLEKLRKDIKTAAPKAEEYLYYHLPAFRLDGSLVVAYGAAANHCALYPGSSSTVEELKEELKAYQTSKGTIRFPSNKPLPTTLVRKVVRARIAENEARRKRPKK